ncbi:hypothetical protein PENSPDRAFT_634554 [Peniophora sp. CONT]|nr:hypothetical protein PENSPDRAFT_634554 [Peniophora sp. CONT]
MEIPSSPEIDALYAERLDAFLQKQLADITTFAAREGRSADEVRRRVSEWHMRRFMDELAQSSAPQDGQERLDTIRSALVASSTSLESLHAATGVHALLVSADPFDATGAGFVGGTPLAREFWRGMRGGGEKGVAALRAVALKVQDNTSGNVNVNEAAALASAKGKSPAYKLKTDVYAKVRAALRTTSGQRTAEMKWTNHAQLQVYGVRLEGWPADVPHANPSTLSAAQNSAVRDAIDGGGMSFVRLDGGIIGGGAGNLRVGDPERDQDGDMWDIVSEDGGLERTEDASSERSEARKRPRLDEGSASYS